MVKINFQVLGYQVNATFEVKRVEKPASPDMAYIALNNLYLLVERGQVKMSASVYNTLNLLVGQAYPEQDDPMRAWWCRELEQLPGYLDC